MGCSSSSPVDAKNVPVCSPSRALSACRSASPSEFQSILDEAFAKIAKLGQTPSQYVWPLVGNPKRSVLQSLLTPDKERARSLAEREGDVIECCRLVLDSPFDCQVDLVTSDSSRLSALDFATGAGQGFCCPPVLLLLLNKGANANKVTGDGYSPLHLYCKQRACFDGDRNESMCDQLILAYQRQGADINKLDGGGRTPLYWAISSGHPVLVKNLLLNGAKPDKTDLSRVDHVTRYNEAGKELVKQYLRLAFDAHREEKEKEKEADSESKAAIPQVTTLRTPAMIATLNPSNGNQIIPRSASHSKTLKTYQSCPVSSSALSLTPSLGAAAAPSHKSNSSTSGIGVNTSTTLVLPPSSGTTGATMKSIAANIVPKGTIKQLAIANKSSNPSPSQSGSSTPERKDKQKDKDKESKADRQKKYATVRSKTAVGPAGTVPSGLSSDGTASLRASKMSKSGTVRVAKVQPRAPSIIDTKATSIATTAPNSTSTSKIESQSNDS